MASKKKYRLRNKLKWHMAMKQAHEGRVISNRLVSSETGIAKTTVDSWAREDVKAIYDHVLFAFCDYFGIEPGDLIYFEVSEESDDSPEFKNPELSIA